MGYTYSFLIKGSKNNEWFTLEHNSYCGSYSAIHNHYFINHLESGTKNEDNGFDYVFSYDDIKKAYDENKKMDNDIILKEIENIIQDKLKDGLTIESVKELLDIIGFKYDEMDKKEVNGFNELEMYYNKCSDYIKTYDKVMLIFSFIP